MTMMRIVVVAVMVLVGVARGAGEVRTLFDFEDGNLMGFGGSAKITTENVPEGGGKYAMVLESGYAVLEKKQDWSGYDLLKIDVMNP
ncbi:MAG: hypothetical protein FWD53_06040, partial [Phycisphaerales bacterium]|nr:hypothetical protein [Phycisphaerales bacterium]